MSAISIATPFNIDLEFNASPVMKRGMAYGIDLLILFLYALAYHSILKPYVEELPEGLALITDLIVYYFPLNFYFLILEILMSGQSFGKKIMGIRVVNINGGKASIMQYFLRALFRTYPFALLAAVFIVLIFSSGVELTNSNYGIFVGAAGVLMVLAVFGMFLYYVLSKLGQRLGDKIADTLVIEDRTKTDIHQTIYLDITDTAYIPRYPEVMRLTDRDINGIKNLLDVKRLTPDSEAYMGRIALRITDVLKITTDQTPYDFLAQLLRDYNYLTSK